MKRIKSLTTRQRKDKDTISITGQGIPVLEKDKPKSVEERQEILMKLTPNLKGKQSKLCD